MNRTSIEVGAFSVRRLWSEPANVQTLHQSTIIHPPHPIPDAPSSSINPTSNINFNVAHMLEQLSYKLTAQIFDVQYQAIIYTGASERQRKNQIKSHQFLSPQRGN